MKLLQRIGYYLGGFSIGLIILAFFLNGKKVSCDYGPEARVLKNINSKQLTYSENARMALSENVIDTLIIKDILLKGDINFSKSKPRQEPCAIYYVEWRRDNNMVTLIIENCDSVAILKDLKWID